MSRSPFFPAPFASTALALAALAAGCAGPAAPAAGGSSPTTTASSAAVPAPPASAPTAAASASASVAAPDPNAVAAPDPNAVAAPTEKPAAAAAPLPEVKVTNIGMHIGGGPNDAVTKEPIKKSVEPHFDAFRACFAEVDDKDKGGDVGVDLRIERGGGKANVSHPRTALKGKAFADCVVKTFEAIEFLPPKGGKTTVSYSLRFTPGKGASGSSRKAPKASSR